jgi:hypothetical protein
MSFLLLLALAALRRRGNIALVFVRQQRCSPCWCEGLIQKMIVTNEVLHHPCGRDGQRTRRVVNNRMLPNERRGSKVILPRLFLAEPSTNFDPMLIHARSKQWGTAISSAPPKRGLTPVVPILASHNRDAPLGEDSTGHVCTSARLRDHPTTTAHPTSTTKPKEPTVSHLCASTIASFQHTK